MLSVCDALRAFKKELDFRATHYISYSESIFPPPSLSILHSWTPNSEEEEEREKHNERDQIAADDIVGLRVT